MHGYKWPINCTRTPVAERTKARLSSGRLPRISRRSSTTLAGGTGTTRSSAMRASNMYVNLSRAWFQPSPKGGLRYEAIGDSITAGWNVDLAAGTNHDGGTRAQDVFKTYECVCRCPIGQAYQPLARMPLLPSSLS